MDGKYALKRKQYDKALEKFFFALELEKLSNSNLKHSTRIGYIQTFIGKAYLAKSDIQAALSSINKALEHYQVTEEGNNKLNLSENAVLDLSALITVKTKADIHLKKYEKIKKSNVRNKCAAIRLTNDFKHAFCSLPSYA